MKKMQIIGMGGLAISTLIVVTIALNSWTTIKAGHVGVGTLFGKVQDTVYEEGFNLVNPLMSIDEVDARQKTHTEAMGVPSKDQLITEFELSIQYRLIKEQAPNMKRETGSSEDVLNIHMIPFLRSQMRELGKSVDKAEDFYSQTVQQRIQNELLTNLSYLTSKGIKVEKVLIRGITLPKIITDAVMRKKNAAQEAEKAKEELRKFKVDQERKEAQAIAEKKAEIIQAEKKKEVMLINANAELEAARIKAKALLVEAEAKAKAKKAQVNVLGRDGFLKLETIKGLAPLSNGNHMIILDPNSHNVLPFMNINK